MAKHRYDMSADRIAKWWSEGRGSGRGKDYRPWLRIQDLSSRGRSSRMPGKTTGRTHELLSDLERAVLLELDAIESVVDIREQFPLPQSSTLRLASHAGIRHPQFRGVETVMTTDFVVDWKAGRRNEMLAISVKYADGLNDHRTVEKLEIERRYWVEEGVRWILVTELDLCSDQTALSLWGHGWHNFEHLDGDKSYWFSRCDQFLAALAESEQSSPLLDIIRQLEDGSDFSPGDGMTVVRHLLVSGKLKPRVPGHFDPRGPASQFEPVLIQETNEQRDAA